MVGFNLHVGRCGLWACGQVGCGQCGQVGLCAGGLWAGGLVACACANKRGQGREGGACRMGGRMGVWVDRLWMGMWAG